MKMRIIITFGLLALCVAGCSHSRNYDGSTAFYSEHPEYQGRPDYYNPATGGDDAQNSNYFGIGNEQDKE